MANTRTMIQLLEAALAENAGVAQVTIDGVTVRYDRAQLLQELDYWQRKAARASGRRPTVSTIDLRRF